MFYIYDLENPTNPVSILMESAIPFLPEEDHDKMRDFINSELSTGYDVMGAATRYKGEVTLSKGIAQRVGGIGFYGNEVEVLDLFGADTSQILVYDLRPFGWDNKIVIADDWSTSAFSHLNCPKVEYQTLNLTK